MAPSWRGGQSKSHEGSEEGSEEGGEGRASPITTWGGNCHKRGLVKSRVSVADMHEIANWRHKSRMTTHALTLPCRQAEALRRDGELATQGGKSRHTVRPVT